MDKKKITTALASVRHLRAQLDAATDSLNAEIATFEKTFASVANGVRVAVKLYETEDAETVWLVFNRYSNEQRLLLVTSSANDSVDDETQPLSSAARQTRLEAVDKFPALLTALEDTLKRQILSLAEKLKVVRTCTELVNESQAEADPFGAPPPGDEDAPF